MNSLTAHGVFLEILGLGVLLTGASGIGKSELALGLIYMGHRLIADDSLELSREQEHLIGRCPPLLQDYLEVRGLGLINVRAMFGDSALHGPKRLQFNRALRNFKPRSSREYGPPCTESIGPSTCLG